MRAFAVSTLAAGLLVAGAGSSLAGVQTQPQTKCVPAQFQGMIYTLRWLESTWVRVGRRIGTAYLVRSYGFECISLPRNAFRVREIRPEAAISLGGSSRGLLVRLGTVCDSQLSDGALVRCLKRIS